MKVKFIPAEYKGKVELSKRVLDYLTKKKTKTVGLYAAIQFVGHLDKIKEQLKPIKAVTSTPKRCSKEGQLLGCDCYADSLNLNKKVDAFLYIGDGKFHPLALLYGQSNKEEGEFKEVVCYDPIAKKMEVMDKKLIDKINKRRKGALIKFHSKKNIGVIISTKPGQQFMKQAFDLEKKYPNKKFYFFIDNNISCDQLENFPFIDVWVNTACPRIGLDDQEGFRKGVVNLRDL